MTSPESSPVSPGTARRPSLFEQPAGHSRTPHREIAVLAPFATAKPVQASVRWATAGVAAVASAFALLAGATVWAVFNGGASEQAAPQAVVQRVPAKPAASPAVVHAAVAAQSDVPDTAPAPAVVVAEPAAGAAMVDATPAPDTAIVATPAPATTETGQVSHSSSATPHVAPSTPAPAPRQASSSAAKPTQHKAAESKPKARSAKPKNEADTALLAALVSHIDHTAAQTANRDVVGASAQQGSTAELVARCDRLGGLEGTLCRKRICKGLWGSDPACPSR